VLHSLSHPLDLTASVAAEVDLLQVMASPWQMHRLGLVEPPAVAVVEEVAVVIAVLVMGADGVEVVAIVGVVVPSEGHFGVPFQATR
jgi:hypothetical protein